METPNNTTQETEAAPASAPVASTPEAAPASAPVASAPAAAPTSAPAPAASAPVAAPAPAPTGMAPQTKGNVSGGWNRFAGYKPGEAKNKKNDRRDQRGRR